MNAIATRTGLRAWLARRFDLICVNATLRAGEADRLEMERQLMALPRRLRVLDRDLAALRVRQALLRSAA